MLFSLLLKINVTGDREFIGGKVIKGHLILRTQKLNTPYFHPSVVTVNNVHRYFSGVIYYEISFR
ncbi:hypothetical protein [Flammeovirga sp. SJP92]|uniref:hypothetical protein n=1 Tax=Flammeovirga sp. SJP92 TaxID=1775430 RepID=UPI0012FAE6AA|nr:hypothetical protein [Flammeovirga sp. SJP92]